MGIQPLLAQAPPPGLIVAPPRIREVYDAERVRELFEPHIVPDVVVTLREVYLAAHTKYMPSRRAEMGVEALTLWILGWGLKELEQVVPHEDVWISAAKHLSKSDAHALVDWANRKLSPQHYKS